ncbi:MAG: glycosyltransferase family 4 protein [Alphaproteobacteria bacterium]|nr:glycosyltransferase family 4 protein [Alphaproteobacteria bacterium]
MLLSYELIFVLTAFVLSFAGTATAYALLKRFRVLDNPNARSNHANPTPRGGGIGIVFSIAFLLIIVGTPWQIVAAFSLLAAISFIDDLRSLSARVRFLAQLVAVGLSLCTMPQIDAITPLPLWVELPVLALAWLWFINLFNFMDGSDGLAVSEAVFIAFGIVLVVFLDYNPYPLLLQSLVVAAAALAFLPWNWHPAKIFMGDVGSVPLGFVLGYLLLSLAMNGYWAAALILPAAFLVDASSTLLLRFLKGERLTQAHSDHAYQKAIRAGLSHDTVAREFTAMNLLLMILALASTFGLVAALASLAVAYLAVSAFLFLRLRRVG